MASPQESSSLCLKRKIGDDSLLKECKSRRVETQNGPSFDSSAERCNHCRACPNLANDCINFLKSGVPSRIMYYKKGSWHNFPERTMKSLIDEFKGNKSSVVVVMDNEPLLVDFLSMTLVNLKTRNQLSVAWFDEAGKCFFPSMFFDEESGYAVKGNAVKIESAQGITLQQISSSPLEVVKQSVIESCNVDILRKKITHVKRDSEDFQFVQDLFLSGMGSFASPENLLHVYRYSPSDITGQCRLEAFERQMRITKEERGDANVRYGWLGCKKDDIVRILIDGLNAIGKPVEKSGLNAGVYLSPENRAFTSVARCDNDEKGVQYMLLCRVILGNMEAIKLGSQEAFPSSKMFDSGVDDCLNPKCYVMWPSHLSTHIRLEYLISFKLAPIYRNYLLGLKGLCFCSSVKRVAMDTTLKTVMCQTGQGPTTPWISFEVLFGVIQDKISPVVRELLFHHYEELKDGKITREEMVEKMMIMVGKKILLEALKNLQQCPSSWYKPSVEASSDTTRMATEQISSDKAGNNCLMPPSATCGDDSRQEFLSLCIASQSPMLHSVKDPDVVKPVPVSPVHAPGCGDSPVISTSGCDSLSLSMVPKGHDPPASSKAPKCYESSTADRMTQSYDHDAEDAAAKVHSAPTLRAVEPDDQAAPCGWQNKPSMPVHASSHVIRAADILVALSTPREKVER